MKSPILRIGNAENPLISRLAPPPLREQELLWNFSERILKTTISFERYAGPLSEFFRSELSRSDFCAASVRDEISFDVRGGKHYE